MIVDHAPFERFKNRENIIMNKEEFEINWMQIRGQSTTWSSPLNDHDLLKVDKANIKLDKYATLLRVKYGYSNDLAKKEINNHMAEFLIPKKINKKII